MLAPWVQQLPTSTKGRVRRKARVGLVLGVLLVVLACVGAGARVIERGWRLELLGALFVLGIGVVLMWNSVRHLRALPPGDAETVVQFTAPYAFVIAADRLAFPSALGRAAEEWPLAQLQVSADGEVLQLRAPGYRMRRFLARALQERPEVIAARIHEAQSKDSHV